MTTATLGCDTQMLLAKNPLKRELFNELNDLKSLSKMLSKEQVTIFLGQWYHPLHYFPVFLSRLVSVAPDIDMQTFISRILWQELGQGDPVYAHEKIYIETMLDAGFERKLFAEAPPFKETEELLAGYKTATDNYLSGLGFLYGTEVADLTMVSTIGNFVRDCTGRKDLLWVDIHVEQEPDHVESSNKTLQPSIDEDEQSQIVESAEQMWKLWINFFKAIKRAILA